MKKTKKPKQMKPGDLDGRRGCKVRRGQTNKWVYHQHIDERGKIVGLECVSTMLHWWLDKEIQRSILQDRDWDFREIESKSEAWQLPWACEYECWREWQPWSDFTRWRKEFCEKVKFLGEEKQDWILGERSRREREEAAAYGNDSGLGLWLLRDFDKFFPKTPWVEIPLEKRRKLKGIKRGGIISIEGSITALKMETPQTGLSATDSESLRAHNDWLDRPGHYREEKVEETKAKKGNELFGTGWFQGTYVIHVPWYCTDKEIKEGFADWMKRHEPKGRKTHEQTGREKLYANLKQLGALRLMRQMSAQKAADYTQKITGNNPLYETASDWSDAKRKADENLAGLFGVSDLA